MEQQVSIPPNRFVELAAINVGEHIEKKGQLSYLSWAWAVDQLLRRDPDAEWTYAEPVKFGDSMMVFCTVTAFGKPRTMQLPVMDNRNKAIANPDAFAVNTAMQRCLVKAIALHGLGLYIYAGEDLPLGESAQGLTDEEEAALQKMRDAALEGTKALETAWKGATKQIRLALATQLDSLKEAAKQADGATRAAA